MNVREQFFPASNFRTSWEINCECIRTSSFSLVLSFFSPSLALFHSRARFYIISPCFPRNNYKEIRNRPKRTHKSRSAAISYSSARGGTFARRGNKRCNIFWKKRKEIYVFLLFPAKRTNRQTNGGVYRYNGVTLRNSVFILLIGIIPIIELALHSPPNKQDLSIPLIKGTSRWKPACVHGALCASLASVVASKISKLRVNKSLFIRHRRTTHPYIEDTQTSRTSAREF